MAGKTGTREHYFGGREHAAIKHFFLKHYLQSLAFKTLQARVGALQAFAYVDGFTGPWAASDDENYSDTSFGVALETLKGVKEVLPGAVISCVFCETRSRPFAELERHAAANAGNLRIKCVRGRFEENIEDIIKFIGPQGFRFAFIDPKGWNVDATAITPLLKHPRSEVLFTFMAEFIGRFPDFDKVRQAYAALLGDVDWRANFDAMPADLSNDDKILALFRRVLKERWGFLHVLEFPIRKMNRDRVFYKLVYGTRSPHGVLAFRDAQSKAEKEGFAVAVESEHGQQSLLFTPDELADQLAASVGVGSRLNLDRLELEVVARLKASRAMPFIKLAGEALELVPAREADVKTTLRKLNAAGRVTFASRDGKSSLQRMSTVSWTG